MVKVFKKGSRGAMVLPPDFKSDPEKRKPPGKERKPASELKPLKPPRTPVEHGECPYVFGDPRDGDWAYCGRKSHRPSRYCEEHERSIRNGTR